MKIKYVRVHALYAPFAEIFGGLQMVPHSLLHPASHFQKIPRLGQYATLVAIESTEGDIGWGEAFGLPHPGMSASLLRNLIAPALVGMTIDQPQEATTTLRSYFYALGHTRGPALEALSAIDIAIWDLLAKHHRVSLCRQLGALPGPVQAYVGSVPFLEGVQETAARALEFKLEGYKGVKLKIGRGAAIDTAHVAATRAALGSDVALMLDANAAYDVSTAIQIANAVAPNNVTWLEEPIRPDDAQGLAKVKAASPIAIAAGENEFAFHQFEQLVLLGAVDILQPNITRAGGVSGLLALDKLCAEYGIQMAPHGVGSAVGVAAALHVCRSASSFAVYEANRLLNPLRDDLSQYPLRASAGAFMAEDRPGHGVLPRPDLLQRYAFQELHDSPEEAS